ncbi:MAG TPA: hypothetical protein VGC21_26075 [Telluria sp.]|jgi:uncharacterized membrane protein YraQ (UPF0718 family)
MKDSSSSPYAPPVAQFAPLAHDGLPVAAGRAVRFATPVILTIAAVFRCWQAVQTGMPLLCLVAALYVAVAVGLALRKTWAKYLYYVIATLVCLGYLAVGIYVVTGIGAPSAALLFKLLWGKVLGICICVGCTFATQRSYAAR